MEKLEQLEILKTMHNLNLGKQVKKASLDVIKTVSTIRKVYPLVSQFLEICSLIRADEIPRSFLEDFVKFCGKPSDEVDIIEDITTCEMLYSRRDDQNGEIFYSMDQLVLISMKYGMEKEWENLIIISKILQNSEKNYPVHLARFFLPYLIQYTGETELEIENFLKLHDEIDTLMTTILAQSLDSIQDIEMIFENYVKVVQVIVKDPNEIFKVYSRMAEVFYANKNWSQCQYYFEKALAQIVEQFGANHIQSASTLKQLGYTLYELGEKEKSLELHEKSLKIQKKNFGENCKFYVEQLTELGEHYFKKNVFRSVHYFNRVAALERAYFQGPTEHTKKKIIICNQRMIQ